MPSFKKLLQSGSDISLLSDSTGKFVRSNDTGSFVRANQTGSFAKSTDLSDVVRASQTGSFLTNASWNSVSGKPSTFAPSAHNQAWSTITGTPTTLAGYGITDAATSGQGSKADTAYGWNPIVSATVSNDTTTYVKADGTSFALTTSDANTNKYVSAAAFGTTTGVLTLTVANGTSVTASLDGRYLTSHPAVSAATSVNNSGGTVIQDVTLDTYGHVTGLTSYNLDGRYYTETEVNSLLAGKQAAGTYDNYVSWTVSDGTNTEAITSGASLVIRGGGATTTSYDAATNTLTINSTDTNTDTNTTYSAGSGIGLSGTTFSVAAGGGLSQDASGLSHADTSTAANLTASGRRYVTGLTFDTYGHVTGYTTGTETVVNTDTNTQRTDEEIQDVVGAMVRGGGSTIVSYDDAANTLTIASTDTDTWRPIHDTPVDGATTTSISSNWAFDNVKTAVPAGAKFTDTTYSVGDGGLTEKNFTTALKTKLDGLPSSADNYGSWTISDGTRSEAIASGNTLQVRGTGATTATYDAATNILTISSTDTNTNTTYTAGGGLTLSGTVFSHTDTSAVSNLSASGRRYVTGLTFDTYGHVTGYTTATETVVDTNTQRTDGEIVAVINRDVNPIVSATVSNDTTTFVKQDGTSFSLTTSDANTNKYLNALAFNTGNGVLTATLNDGNTVTVDLDGRFTDNGYADAMNQHVRVTDSPTFAGMTVNGNLTVTGTTITNNVETLSTTNGVVFEGNVADGFEALLLAGTVTADRTIYLPDADGTVALTSQLPTVNNATLTVQGTGALGGSGTFTANQSTNATISISHDDTSTLSGAYGGSGISSVTVDGYGHVTAIGTATYDNYSSWTISDGTTSEAIGSGASLIIRGGGASSTSYDAATNTLTISSTDTNTNTVTSVGVTGDLSTGNITLAGSGATSVSKSGGTITISSTDTNTTYAAGSGLTLSGTTFAHADTSTQASVNNSGRTYIQDITLDGYGHVTGIASATETVVNTDTITRVGIAANEVTGTVTFQGSGATTVTQTGQVVTISSTDTNTDTNNYANSLAFDTGTGVLTLGRQGLANLTVDLDGRFTDNGYADTMNQHVRTTDAPSFTRLGVGQAADSTVPLTVYASGSTVFDVQGSVGQLFSVTDSLTGDIFAVSDISGMPILNVNSDGTVTVDDTLVVSGSITTTADGSSSNWKQAYDNYITGISVTGTTTKTITLTQRDGGTITGTFTDIDTNTDTTYSQATSSALGLVKIGYAENGKNYPVELNASGQMYVNVPWVDTDTNTIYSGWSVSDGTLVETVGSGQGVIFAGSGNVTTSYNLTSNTMTIGMVAEPTFTSARMPVLNLSKSGTDSYINFDAQTNDPGYIRHYESNNTARMYFSVSDDNGTTDYFGFGYSGSTERFIIYSNGSFLANGDGRVTGTFRADGDIIAYYSSDERLKENIKPIENASEKIKKIGGYTYDWNDKQTTYEPGTHDMGVIAQEVEEVAPELVTTRDNGYKAVKYEKLVALLIESNKELLARVEALEEQLKTK